MTVAFLEIDNESHRYFVNGVEQISVTQVLERAGLISTFSQRDEQARWRGDAIAKLTARLDIEGRLDLRQVPTDLRGYIRAWKNYKRDRGINTFYAVEKRVDSRQYGFSGRLDRMRQPTAGEFVIADIKTGAIPGWVRYQLAGYGIAVDEHHCFGREAVQLKPDGRYVVKQYPRSSYLEDCREFLRLLDKVKRENQDGSRITE